MNLGPLASTPYISERDPARSTGAKPATAGERGKPRRATKHFWHPRASRPLPAGRYSPTQNRHPPSFTPAFLMTSPQSWDSDAMNAAASWGEFATGFAAWSRNLF